VKRHADYEHGVLEELDGDGVCGALYVQYGGMGMREELEEMLERRYSDDVGIIEDWIAELRQ